MSATRTSLARQSFGRPFTVSTFTKVTPSSFDKSMLAINMDPEYIKFVQKAVKDDLFIDGTGVDVLSRKF